MEVNNNLSIVPYENALPPEMRHRICSFLGLKELLAFRECAHFTNADVIEVKREHVFKEKKLDTRALKIFLEIFPRLSHLAFFGHSSQLRELTLPCDLLQNREAIKKLTLTKIADLDKDMYFPDMEDILQALRYFPKVQELRIYSEVDELDHIIVKEQFEAKSVEQKIIYHLIEAGIIEVSPFHTAETLDKIKKYDSKQDYKWYLDTPEGRTFASLKEYMEAKERFQDLKTIDLSGTKSFNVKFKEKYKKKNRPFLSSVYYTLTFKSPDLQTLILNDCRDCYDCTVTIFGAFLEKFPQCNKLQNLHLRNTEVKDKHLERIAKKCPQLKFLDLRGCKSITIDGIKTLQFHYKKNPITIEHDLETNKD